MEIFFRLGLFLLILLAQSKATEYKDRNPVLIEQAVKW